MTPARIVVLGIALVAGGGAALLMATSKAPVEVKDVVRTEKAPTVEVLVAAVEVPLGNQLTANDIRWLAWPADSVPAGLITKKDSPEAEKEIIGQVARASLVVSEPVRRERLMKTDGSGFLSAILPSGKRAVAITTDSKGASTAGGFILPNDRVDVIRTSQEDSRSASSNATYSSETILSNVKVLAIGQNVQERNGEKVVIGETATLEIDPKQAELLAMAQRAGGLSLALRSLQDAKDAPEKQEDGSLTLVRYGIPTKSSR